MIQDPITFEVIKNALISCAREMSQALRRTAFSPNIKERRDCSCALFDNSGRLVAQSKDIPVHLGAMPLSVKACIKQLGDEIVEGSMALVNDPYSGGSHLPDLTLVSPVHHEGELIAFVANRAHHADVGGSSPGSMPGFSLALEDEGIIIPPRIVVSRGELQRNLIYDLLEATRTPDERLGDLSAQVAANLVGTRQLTHVADRHGLIRLVESFQDLRTYSAEMMASALAAHAGKRGWFTDYMDSDGAGRSRIPICVDISISERGAEVGFEGTSGQVPGNINCPLASTLSCIYYVFITLFGREIPTNEGCWNIIDVSIPEGSLLNPRYPAPVSAGNVETSQRIVDVMLGAMASIVPDLVPAASQGTMNNLTIGGIDRRRESAFSFYETIGGGSGAVRGMMGTSGIHSHMTNTLNTPVEALEIAYPLRVRKYSVRRNTGGRGQWRGGDGIIREIEVLGEDCTISIQSERRESKPWGINGGLSGAAGRNTVIYEDCVRPLHAKSTVKVPSGAVVRVETPGGGGWGVAQD